MLMIVSVIILGAFAWLIFDACMALLFLLLARVIVWRANRKERFSLTE